MNSEQVKAVGIFGIISIIILGLAISDLVKRQNLGEQIARIDDGASNDSTATQEAAAEVKVTNGSDSGPPSETESALEEDAQRASSDGLGPNPVVPSYDLIRVEPSGEAVFAGQGEPGWLIELRRAGEVIGSTKVDSSGDWVIVTDEPFPAGPNEVTLQAMSSDGVMTVNSPNTVTVAVDEEKEETPLVLLTSPNAATDVVQLPAAEEPAEGAQSADGSTSQEDDAQDTSGTEVAADEGSDSQAVNVAAGAESSGEAEESNIASTDNLTDQSGTEVSESNGADVAADGSQPATDGDPQSAETAGASSKPEQVASVSPGTEPEQSAPVEEERVVSIETVEADTKGQLFVSGLGEPGETVRIYAGNELVGDATVAQDGSWSIKANKELGQGENAIRVDALGDGEEATPTARAEVTFDRPDLEKPVIAFAPLPTSRAQPVTASANRLIVQRGDNLWNIAREIYGEGVRFSVIYQANTRQIRNPDLIFPGQVFAVPNNPRFGSAATVSN